MGIRARIKKPFDQPMPVHVSDSVKDYRAKTVNFIVASLAELSLTNFTSLQIEDNLLSSLKAALTKPVFIKPTFKVLTSMDYVNQVAKPSLLNKIQTEIYKIQPYALRKQTQVIVLDYFNNRISQRQLKQMMSNNLKQEAILPLLMQAQSLRDAVARLGKETVEEVAASTGHPTFELLYLSKERK
jgi:hypothetical protein